MKNFKIGDNVVRAKGDYVVGRTGNIIKIKEGRARVEWEGENKTWVKFDVIELTSIPYRIDPPIYNKQRRISFAKYKALSLKESVISEVPQKLSMQKPIPANLKPFTFDVFEKLSSFQRNEDSSFDDNCVKFLKKHTVKAKNLNEAERLIMIYATNRNLAWR